jgi:hypothetical protein
LDGELHFAALVGLYQGRNIFFLNAKYVRHDIKTKNRLHVSTGSILCVAGKQ